MNQSGEIEYSENEYKRSIFKSAVTYDHNRNNYFKNRLNFTFTNIN